MITERLLQYIWQFQCYNHSLLQTTTGESLQVIHPGTFNSNQGPDFRAATIVVGGTTWVGNVELHVNTSGWKQHGHSGDPHYANVILHVVWHNDEQATPDFFTLELQSRVPGLLLKKYETLMLHDGFIPCSSGFAAAAQGLAFTAWKERLLAERLEQKAALFRSYLRQTNHHWEEAFWWFMARSFGATANSAGFERTAQSIPLNILGRVKPQLHQLEALFFGQAGLLNREFTDEYPRMLADEYRFLRAKYGLHPAPVQLFFLRMRPAGFPTIRLAQLAALVHRSLHLFAAVRECSDTAGLKALLDVTAGAYWNTHFLFEETSAYQEKKLGADMTAGLIINTIVPAVFAWGQYHGHEACRVKPAQWLQELKAEKNNITKGFAALGAACTVAADSQALIQLKNEYCNRKRCLDCTIGSRLIGSAESW